MKIAIMITSLSTGGAERTAVALSNWLVNNGNKTYLINLGTNEKNYEIDSKVILYNKRKSYNLFEKIFSIVDVIKYLNNIKPDIIFEMLYKPIKYAIVNKLFNRKQVLIGSERANPEKRRWFRRITTSVCYPLLCDGYIFQTEKVKKMFIKKIQNRGIVIGNAISNPDVYKICKEKNPDKIITSAGRLTKQKGFDILIKAFAKVHEIYPEYKLVIYGEGEERKNLESIIESLGLINSVFLPGVSKNYLNKVAKSDIFVMSSRFEGMPNALLEAMAIGMPCISTDCVAGPSELIRDYQNGILVKVDNIDEISEKIIQLINNPKLKNKISINAKQVINEHSQDIIYQKYNDYFFKVYKLKNNKNKNDEGKN